MTNDDTPSFDPTDEPAADSSSAENTDEAADEVTTSGEDLNSSLDDHRRYRDDATAKVPEIGDGKRWYDLPYKTVNWLLRGRPRGLLPRPVRERLGDTYTSLHAFNDLDQYRVWDLDDTFHNYKVPTDEHATFPTIWVVELFPPSRYEQLQAASSRNNWDKRRELMQQERNLTMLEASRGGRGWYWWRLAEIADPRAPYSFPDGAIEQLPEPFFSVELRAINVGPSLTAVIGCFTLDQATMTRLDDVWHATHEPSIIRRGQVFSAQDRMWSGFRITQQARGGVHEAARTWMNQKVPGFFSTSDEPQPILDLLLTDNYDPSLGQRPPRDFDEALRALGITGHDVEYKTSPHLPGLILISADGNLCRDLEHRNTWTLWGRRDTVKEAFGEALDGYGSDPNRAIAQVVDNRIRMFLIGLSFSAYTSKAKAQHSKLRDNATARHRRFRAKQLRALRKALLTLSIDLAGMERDTAAFWARRHRWDPVAPFHHSLATWIAERDQETGRPPAEPLDYNKHLRKEQRRQLRTLIDADNDYRDILATVASLGASADSTRVGRLALAIAAASLVVSGVTLWVTEHDDPNPPTKPTVEQRR